MATVISIPTATARASTTPKLRVPSIDTTTRGPGARSAIQAGSSEKLELLLLIFRVPIGVPVGSAISTSWVSRWVSTPTTASTSSASMGTGLVLPCREWVNVGTGLGRGHRVAHL